MDNTINVVLTSSDAYVPYTYVCMQSIIKNTNKKINFYILSDNMSEVSKNYLSLLSNSIKYINVDISSYPTPMQSRAHPIVYSKLFLPSLLPDLKKCLVLDSDIIVNCDISKLYNIDLKDNYVAWVADPIDINTDTSSHVNSINQQKQYINSGVLLLNLTQYKLANIEQKIFDNYNKYQNHIVFFDQDLLYITLSHKAIYLDYIYNYLPTLQYQKPGINEYCDKNYKILHFGTDIKPWFYPSSKFANIWWSYARQTPFYEEILQRLVDFRISQLKPQANNPEIQQLRKEFVQVHFPNINNRFAANEYNNKLLFVIEHPMRFKLKKSWYAIKKAFAFGKRYQKYKQKYQSLKTLLKDAKKLKKSFFKI